MPDYIRLAEAPRWVIQYPLCSACNVDLENDGDGWVCPCCGTAWSNHAGDGDQGELYAAWAGEESEGPMVSEDDAHLWGEYLERLERHRLLPDFCPKPDRPRIKEGA